MPALTRVLFPLMMLFLAIPSLFALASFPGAEGWGAASVGGRGGKVIHVTNLRVSGAGSLPAAIAVAGPKIIVFDTAGVINLASNPLRITSYTTIAGQTAPGGITIINGGIYTASGATNIIVRHLRVRRSPDAPDGDCMRFDYATDCIYDHCSGMWCSDEILDFVHCARITVQYTSISEPASCYEHYGTGSGWGNTRTGILGNTVVGGITLYRCLMSDHSKRTPYLSNNGASNAGHTYEFINNFIYNCSQASGESFSDGNTIPLNLVANYYKPGRNAVYFPPYFAHRGTATRVMRVHASGNVHSSQPTRTSPSNFFDSTTVSSFSDTFILPRMTQNVMTATQAMDEVMAKVGPFPRDDAETRVVNETRAATAAWMTTCAALADPLMGFAGPKITDTDKDGMADSWETAHGFNPNDSSDYKTVMISGYTAIEAYVNELSDTLVVRGAAASESPVFFAPAPSALRLSPNPFTSRVVFLVKPGAAAPSELAVWNASGQRVFCRTLTPAGNTDGAVEWDGLRADGSPLPAGSYLVTFTRDRERYAQRLALIR